MVRCRSEQVAARCSPTGVTELQAQVHRDVDDARWKNHLQCLADDVRYAIDGLTLPQSQLDSAIHLLELFSSARERLALKQLELFRPTMHAALELVNCSPGTSTSWKLVQAHMLLIYVREEHNKLALSGCNALCGLNAQEICATLCKLLSCPRTATACLDNSHRARIAAAVVTPRTQNVLSQAVAWSPLAVALMAARVASDVGVNSEGAEQLRAAAGASGLLRLLPAVVADAVREVPSRNAPPEDTSALWFAKSALAVLENLTIDRHNSEFLATELLSQRGPPAEPQTRFPDVLFQLLARGAGDSAGQATLVGHGLGVLVNMTNNCSAGCAAVVDGRGLDVVTDLAAQLCCADGGGLALDQDRLHANQTIFNICISVLINVLENASSAGSTGSNVAERVASFGPLQRRALAQDRTSHGTQRSASEQPRIITPTPDPSREPMATGGPAEQVAPDEGKTSGSGLPRQLEVVDGRADASGGGGGGGTGERACAESDQGCSQPRRSLPTGNRRVRRPRALVPPPQPRTETASHSTDFAFPTDASSAPSIPPEQDIPDSAPMEVDALPFQAPCERPAGVHAAPACAPCSDFFELLCAITLQHWATLDRCGQVSDDDGAHDSQGMGAMLVAILMGFLARHNPLLRTVLSNTLSLERLVAGVQSGRATYFGGSCVDDQVDVTLKTVINVLMPASEAQLP